jgi:hypothetical protein
MANVFDVAKGNKTYITLGLTIIGTVAAYFMGDISLPNAIYAVIGALSGIFIRSGINTATDKQTEKIEAIVDKSTVAPKEVAQAAKPFDVSNITSGEKGSGN